MHKIFALYSNEITKISRKISVWILLVLMFVACLLVPIVMHALTGNYYWTPESEASDKASMTKMRDSAQQQLGDPNSYIQHATLRFTMDNEVFEFFGTYINLDPDKLNLYVTMTCYNDILTNYDFDAYPITDNFLSERSLIMYNNAYSELCQLNNIPFEERDNEWFRSYQARTEVFDYTKAAFFNHDYQSLCAAIDANRNFRVGETMSYMGDTDFLYELAKIDPEGKLSTDETMYRVYGISSRKRWQNTLDQGFESVGVADSTHVLLTDSRRAEIENMITIINYQLNNNCQPMEEAQIAVITKQLAQTVARFFLVILLIVVAGSSISQEMATGSIKSLIIAPVKRWKIFLAKILALLSLVIVGSFLITATSTLTTIALFGAKNLTPYYYVSGGQVKTMSHFTFSFLCFFTENISLLFYVNLAFMISCLSKNTAAAVGISSGLVLGSGVLGSFLEYMGKQRWIDFLPSSNLSLTGKIFPYLSLMGYPDATEGGVFLSLDSGSSNSLTFSIIYLIVLTFIIYLIAYDGFVKRDIQ